MPSTHPYARLVKSRPVAMRGFATRASACLALAAGAQVSGQTTTLSSAHPESGGWFGSVVASVPDTDGDGTPDIAVGAFRERVGTILQAGRVTIHSGATGAILRTLVSPTPELLGFFGSAVAGVPDVNGDGRGDLIVGAPFEGNGLLQGIGRAYLISGADGVRLRTFSAGAPESGDLFGSSVAGLPDMNGDGRGDIAIGAALADPGGAPTDSGRAFIYSGATGAFLRGMASPKQEAGGAFGTSIAGLPDVNGNGKGDIVVGAPLEDTPNISDVGRVYLFRN